MGCPIKVGTVGKTSLWLSQKITHRMMAEFRIN
jgi:hypothetical protein